MKSSKSAKFVMMSFMFLAINLLLSINSFPLKAQNPNLKNTSWKANATFIYPPNQYYWELNYFILDKKNIRVDFEIRYTLNSYQQVMDPVTGRFDWKYIQTTGSEPSKSEEGTYEQNGDLIKMAFPSHQIDGAIKNNRMFGEIKIKGSDKAAWSASRVSENTEAENVEDKKKDFPKNIYGPWDSYENLFTGINNYFCDKLLNKATSNEAKLWIKKNHCSKERSLYGGDFKEVSKLLAAKLNKFLGEEIFKEDDFLPPKEPNEAFDPITGVGQNPWTITRYIKEVYNPAVRRAFKISN